VWTSGGAEGDSCDLERQFAWCAVGTLLNESDVRTPAYWTKEPEAKVSTDKCLTLNYAATSVGLLAADCTATKQLLCQVSLNTRARIFYNGGEFLHLEHHEAFVFN
jgi:hypothetical protein